MFQKQAATALQLADVLMTKDVIALAPVWAHFDTGERGDEFGADAYLNVDGEKTIAGERRDILLKVRDGNYDRVLPVLDSLRADAARLMTPAAAEKMNGFATEAAIWAARGTVWKQRGLLAPAYAQTPAGQ